MISEPSGKAGNHRGDELDLGGRESTWGGNQIYGNKAQRIHGNQAKGTSGQGQHLREGEQMGASFFVRQRENQPIKHRAHSTTGHCSGCPITGHHRRRGI